MEGRVGPGGLLKKKTSSGCLIIKKKGDNKNLRGVAGGLAIDSNERKRKRLVTRDSSTSEEDESLAFMRRKLTDKRLENGSMRHERSDIENRGYVRCNAGVKIGGERKRTRSDLYDFDEYDDFDEKNMSNEHAEGPYRIVGHDNSFGNSYDFVVGSSNKNSLVNKQKKFTYSDGSISSSLFKYHEATDEPIRVQGKNGVLKVMVNKKKKLEMPSHYTKYDPLEVEMREGFRSAKVAKKDSTARLQVCTDSNPPENSGSLIAKSKKVKVGKHEVKAKKIKPNSSKCIDDKELDNVSTDTVFKLAPGGVQSCSSKKRVKKEVEESPPYEKIIPVKGKDPSESKSKRGGSTEKQMLREKIKGMLIDAGWTIDHRPRRNRDYLDAVYINPSGTAYWSIIKAYDALKKQLSEDCRKRQSDAGSPSFAPLSEDLISKLTRQTKKKIEEAKRKKTKEYGLTKSSKKLAVRYNAESSDSDQNEEISCGKQNTNLQRGKFQELYEESEDDFSDDSPKRNSSIVASSSNILQERTSKKIGRCTLLVRSFDRGENSDSHGYIPYNGKRTLLAWLIDSGSVNSSERVQYMNRKRTRAMLEGWITRDGIHCGCCSKILTVSKFELHAGSKLRQPFQNIFVESGQSLLQCQVNAWNGQPDSARRDFCSVDVDGGESDDDTCGICGDGGALICCDSCPSTFHQICLDIQMLPSGDWHCPNCACKYCGVATVNNDDGADELIKCTFCERKYHKSCCEKVVTVSSGGSSLCGIRCRELYNHLEKIHGVKHELEGGFSWSLIRRSVICDTSHRGYPQMVECNSKLAVALSVMDECFLPIIDRRSGIHVIHNVVYNCGSNFNRLNYRGFYTAILERGDEIVAAASIRIHGALLAEMPFIGTREMYRRQGMCRRLLSSIERELGSLKIRHLVIPAISEHKDTWTTAFGFNPLEDALRKEIKSTNMLVFPGTDMLQKQLANPETCHGKDMTGVTKNQYKSSINSSVERNKSANEDSDVFLDTGTLDKVDSLGTSSAEPDTHLNDKVVASDSDSDCVSDKNSDAETKQEQLSPRSEGACTVSGKDDLTIELNGLLGKDNNAKSVINTGNHEAPLKISGDSPTSEAEANVESGQVTDGIGDKDVLMKVYENVAFDKVVMNDDYMESTADSTFETPKQILEDEDNAEPIAPTLAIVNEQETLVPELKLNQATREPSPDHEVANGDINVINGSASCSKKNIELDCVRVAEDSSPDVSDKDVVKRIDENKDPANLCTPDSEKTISPSTQNNVTSEKYSDDCWKDT